MQNGNSVVSSLSPFFFANEDNESIKSVAQRLTFDEFSSDEMEMTENDEDDKFSLRSPSSISSPNTDSLGRLKYRQNITRKNLAKVILSTI